MREQYVMYLDNIAAQVCLGCIKDVLTQKEGVSHRAAGSGSCVPAML